MKSRTPTKIFISNWPPLQQKYLSGGYLKTFSSLYYGGLDIIRGN